MQFPQELIEQFKRHNVVAFIGGGLSGLAGLPTLAELAHPLAARLRTDPSIGFQRITQLYDVQFGRIDLINYLREKLDTTNAAPSEIHKLISLLPTNIFITTALDDLLEKAFSQAGRKLNSIIIGSDLAFWNEEQTQLIKLHGDLTRPDSLVITQQDYLTFFKRYSLIKQKLVGLLLTKTFFFIGYELDAPDFELIYSEIAFDLEQYQRTAYIILANPTSLVVQDLKSRHFYVIGLDLKDHDSYIGKHLEMLRQVVDLVEVDETTRGLKHRAMAPIGRLSHEVELLMVAMGYQVLDVQTYSHRRIEILCSRKEGPRTQHVIVSCIEGELDINDVRDLQAQLSGQTLGYLVAQVRVAPSARRLVSSLPQVEVFTFREFYRRLVDFDDYVHNLVRDFAASEVHNYYVDLNCEKRYYNAEGREVGSDIYKLDEYIDSWLQEDGRNHMSILGNFGSGKSWFCRQYAAKQAKRYLADPDHQRIPILISLRDYSKAMNIQQLITDLLINKYQIRLDSGYRGFEKVNADGKLLILFDGFDEMESRVDYRTTVSNFDELSKVVVPNGKVVLTCRTPYFRSNLEMKEVFSSNRDESAVIDLRSRPNFETVHLLDFDDNQIQFALQKRLADQWTKVYEQIQLTYDLPGLARRPVLLDMIARSIPFLREDQRINQATLYRAYTDQWIERNVIEERTLLDSNSKRYFMRELAWEMYIQQRLSLHFSDIPSRVQIHFGLIVSRDIDHFAHDIRTQSFLQRDEEGYYRFAHKSFLEFFVADRLAEEIHNGYVDTLKQRIVSIELLAFLKHMLSEEVDLLLGLLDHARHKDFKEIGYLASNLVSLLNVLGYNFNGTDLSYTALRHAYLQGADLTNAKFVRVDAEGTNLQAADLSGSDFSYANLKSVLIGETKVVRAVASSPDGKYIACGGSEPSIRILRASSGEEIKRIPVFASLRALAFSPDGNYIISGGADSLVRVWDWKSNHLVMGLEGHVYSVFCLAYSPNGQYIASGGQDGTVRIWHAASQESLATFTTQEKYIRCLTFTQDSQRLVIGGSEGLIYIWDLREKRTSTILTGHQGFVVYGLSCSPSGEYFISTSNDRTAKIWLCETWRQVAELQGFEDTVLGVSIHPVEHLAATADRVGNIRIWDTDSWKEVLRFGQDAPILSIIYRPDGQHMVTGGGDGSVRSWYPSTGECEWQYLIPEQEFSFQGTNITGVKGWAPEWIRYMLEMGAITSDP